MMAWLLLLQMQLTAAQWCGECVCAHNRLFSRHVLSTLLWLQFRVERRILFVGKKSSVRYKTGLANGCQSRLCLHTPRMGAAKTSTYIQVKILRSGKYLRVFA